MADKRPVTVKGPDGEFQVSLFTYSRLYQGHKGFTLTVGEDGELIKTKKSEA